MTLGAEFRPSQPNPTGGDFQEQLGSKNNEPFMLYEEYKPDLPAVFDDPNGWRYLRTGPVNGGTSRHPYEEWLSDRSLGPGFGVQLAAIFVYNPTKGETIVEEEDKIGDYFRRREEFRAKGWRLVPSTLYRVVGYRPFTVQQAENTPPVSPK